MPDDGDAEVLEVVDRQLGSTAPSISLSRNVALVRSKAEAPAAQTPDIHRCFLRGANVDDGLAKPQCLRLWLRTLVWVERAPFTIRRRAMTLAGDVALQQGSASGRV